MDQNKEKGISKKVYIGNIPYTANKEEVESLLRIVGPVINFELNYDKEAGKEKKHKGFGFCEYPDYETALSAIRNLNELEFQSRCLKVGFEAKAEQTMAGKGFKTDSSDFDPANFELKNENKNLTEILVGLDMPQKYFIMKELKNIKELAESELKVILTTNPKLSQEILKMQNELGLDNIQPFEKRKTKNENLLNVNHKTEKKLKTLFKKKSPKKGISKTLPTVQKVHNAKMNPKEKNDAQELQNYAYQTYQEPLHKNNPNLINQELPRSYVNEAHSLFNNQVNPNSNRMYYGVNQTLMMDIHNAPNANYQNEALLNKGFQQKNIMANNVPSQNYMRNNHNMMNQQYPQSSFMNYRAENDKKWSVTDNIFENNEHFFNNNKPIMENEKIKKKINPGYYQNNFQMQNENFRQKPSQEGFDEKGENYFGNEPEFSPNDVQLHVTDELKNLLYKMDDDN